MTIVRNELPILRERLIGKFEVGHKNGCCLWTACLGAGGYGVIYFKGKNIYAHRAVYEAFVGPIPNGYTLDHLCRVRRCVNPFHLEPVTSAENTRRGIRHNSTKTHCSRGHAYDLKNTYVTAAGWRICRKCQSMHERNRRAKIKEEHKRC